MARPVLMHALLAGLLVWTGCESEDGAAECAGHGGTECAAGCGSDVVAALVCEEGEWKCPTGYVHGYTECPPGTCFGPPMDCCSPTGDREAMYCEPYEGGLPSGAACPPGYTATWKGGPCSDAGTD